MFSDPQKAVFSSLAENRALFEALKEHLMLQFESKVSAEGLTNEQLGAIARARYEGEKVINQVFNEIASLRKSETKTEGVNPAL